MTCIVSTASSIRADVTEEETAELIGVLNGRGPRVAIWTTNSWTDDASQITVSGIPSGAMLGVVAWRFGMPCSSPDTAVVVAFAPASLP